MRLHQDIERLGLCSLVVILLLIAANNWNPKDHLGKAVVPTSYGHTKSTQQRSTPTVVTKKSVVVSHSGVGITKSTTTALVKAPPKSVSTHSTFASTPSWSQDFATMPSGVLSGKYWNFETGNNDGWGNNEVEYYTARTKNIQVTGGNLVLAAYQEQYAGYNYTSARIDTQGKFDFTYGKIVINAKMPEGAGVWPALWLWPSGNKYGSEPLTANEQSASWLVNGEIDILEGQAQGDNEFSGSAHSVDHYPGNAERTGYVYVTNAETQYHAYELDWTPQKLTFLVDGKAFYTVTNPGTGFRDWPYDQQFHLIMNIAMGGTMDQNLDSTYPPNGIDNSRMPWVMSVKSIMYYPLASS